MKRLSRHRFLETGLRGAASLALAPYVGRFGSVSRPNIVLIMSDEHNASVLGCGGNAIVRTPHLDSLSRNGITFDACYTNSPLCGPARAAFVSGRYASRNSVWSNNCELPSDATPSIAGQMAALGYDPFLCGKMHFAAGRSYGFLPVGEAEGTHKDGTGHRRAADDLQSGHSLSPRFRQFFTDSDSMVMRHDRGVTERAVRFLDSRPADTRPFLLTLGYLAPHFPLIVPQRYRKHYRGKLPPPPLTAGYLAGLPLNYRHLRNAFRMEAVPEDVAQKGRELYYGLVEWFDEQVGCVLQALERSAVASNTIVIYTSDHGENLGQHGLWWKNTMFDSSARVPLIVSGTNRWRDGSRRGGPCSLVDLSSTLIDLAGGRAPDDWDGSSLVPLLDSAASNWKDTAISEYYGHNVASGFAMIRRGDLKYVYHTAPDRRRGPEQELYNLREDPNEMLNRARDGRYAPLAAALHRELVRQLGEAPDRTEARCRASYAAANQRVAYGGRSTRHANRHAGSLDL